jgi:sterol desaturase/sphingolipid hydroxylase (fatty acid hydroxylase superfamily)
MHAFSLQAFLHAAPQMWLHGLFIDVRRYVIFAVAVWFTLWVLLNRPLRARKIREASPPMRQLLTEFAYSVRSVAIFSTVGVLVVTLLDDAGFYPLAKVATSWGPGWFAASLVLMIIGQDAWVYWTHRWMHRPRWFRSFHRRHHLSHNPSPFTAYSFDLGEALLMVGFVVIWPLVMPTPWPVIGLFMLHQIFRNTLLHAGYELTPARADGRPWLGWLTTTTHHDLHHAQAGYNFAPWFTWWDRALGTEHPQYLARYAETAQRPLRGKPEASPEWQEA